MANPWDQDEIVQAGANPWNADEVVTAPAPALRRPDGSLTEAGWEAEKLSLTQKRKKEIEGQSFLDNASAGYGRAIPTLFAGLKQTGTEAIRSLIGNRSGMGGGNAITRWADRSLANQQREIDSERRDSADLMSTGGGMVGNFAGNAVPIVGTGGYGAIRGAPMLASTLLPRTLLGNVAQGTAFAGTQPTVTGESRGLNALLGGTIGSVAHGASKVPSGLARLIPSVRNAGIEAQAGKALEGFATDPKAVRGSLGQLQQIVPGSFPTTAEATGDIGLANLQRTMQSNNSGGFNALITDRQAANNVARGDAIRSAFGGADESVAQGMAATRDAGAKRVLRPIGGITMQGQDSINTMLDRLIEKNAAAPLVRSALNDVKAELPNVKTVQDAHHFRQYIDQLINGVVDNKAGAKRASYELNLVKGQLDRNMRAAYPEWATFLRDYKSASKEINQVNFGAKLLDKSNAARDINGNPVLNATFLRASDNLDSVAKAVNPGFKRANADAMLTTPQKETVDAVRRDLERQMNAWNRGRAVGSNTFQNLSGGSTLQQEIGPLATTAIGAIDPTRGIALAAVNGIRQRGGDRVAMLLSEAMMDPQRAAEILARVPSQHRTAAVGALGHVFRQSAISGERTRQTQRPGLEIDIVGGTPIPDAEYRRLYGN